MHCMRGSILNPKLCSLLLEKVNLLLDGQPVTLRRNGNVLVRWMSAFSFSLKSFQKAIRRPDKLLSYQTTGLE